MKKLRIALCAILVSSGCASLNDTIRSEPQFTFELKQSADTFSWCMHRWLRDGGLGVERFESGIHVQAGGVGTAVAVSANDSVIKFWSSSPWEEMTLEAIEACNADADSFPYKGYGLAKIF
jgi:hypothetical protein